ncbi:peroxynitrite isomerase THAP4-like [Venturia canescens]|uniref:peroxynitrite isomerase THAP4-like n=1 Tax=Venturia canescens TaxID=32260 RepID=UPI001C9BD88F|nr:peroxynitrite isomerase THAP4-like [Venturia canescens]XP_043273044.1 peroxynitrite isomerase THAP4-like [Venturia canescens]
MNRCLPMHNAIKSLSWLEGTWRTETIAQGQFPTIKPFTYCDEIKFISIGQPMLNFEAQSWHPEKKNPMHREVGFLKVIPESNKVALVVSHNFGLTTIEEGFIGDNEIKLESVSIARMSQGTKEPGVTKLKRELKLVGNDLEQIVHMATTTTPEYAEHLRARYVKLPRYE